MNIEHARDPNLRNFLTGLRRAARRTREVALATHTGLIVASNGKLAAHWSGTTATSGGKRRVSDRNKRRRRQHGSQLKAWNGFHLY